MLRLAPVFESGWLSPLQFLPVWADDLHRIAALMAYSAFISRIHLEDVNLNRVIELEEELKI